MVKMAKVGLNVYVLLLIIGGAMYTTATITTGEFIENSMGNSITVHCSSLTSDFGKQLIDSGSVWSLNITSSLDDPTVTCVFLQEKENLSQRFELWNYVKSGYSDTPWFSCNPDCSWKIQKDGFYYLAQSGGYQLYSSW